MKNVWCRCFYEEQDLPNASLRPPFFHSGYLADMTRLLFTLFGQRDTTRTIRQRLHWKMESDTAGVEEHEDGYPGIYKVSNLVIYTKL